MSELDRVAKNSMEFKIERRDTEGDTRGCTVSIKGFLRENCTTVEGEAPVFVAEGVCAHFLWDFINGAIFAGFEADYSILSDSARERLINAILSSPNMSSMDIALMLVAIEVRGSGRIDSMRPAPIVVNPLAYHENRDPYTYYAPEIRKPVLVAGLLNSMLDYLGDTHVCEDPSQCSRRCSCPMQKLKQLIEFVKKTGKNPCRDDMHKMLEDMSPKTVWEVG